MHSDWTQDSRYSLSLTPLPSIIPTVLKLHQGNELLTMGPQEAHVQNIYFAAIHFPDGKPELSKLKRLRGSPVHRYEDFNYILTYALNESERRAYRSYRKHITEPLRAAVIELIPMQG